MPRLKGPEDPELHVGLGGNYYVICRHSSKLIEVCKAIGKSPKGIYWREEYQTFAIRVRLGETKAKLRSLFNKTPQSD